MKRTSHPYGTGAPVGTRSQKTGMSSICFILCDFVGSECLFTVFLASFVGTFRDEVAGGDFAHFRDFVCVCISALQIQG